MKRMFGSALVGALAILLSHGVVAQKLSKQLTKPSTNIQEQQKDRDGSPDPQVAVQMANDYFNATRVMTADFVQVGADGKHSEGKLYVLKPGRLRFEYALPATMEIIADGVSVAVRDRKLHTQQLYFINETPLKFLLKDYLDLKNDVKITDVSSNAASTIIAVRDSSTFGGTSTIKLNFDRKSFALQQWEVTDPQGFQTVVTLHNIDLKTTPNQSLFRIPPTTFWPMQN